MTGDFTGLIANYPKQWNSYCFNFLDIIPIKFISRNDNTAHNKWNSVIN